MAETPKYRRLKWDRSWFPCRVAASVRSAQSWLGSCTGCVLTSFFLLLSVTLGHCSCPPGPRGLTLHRQEGRGEGHWAHPVFAGASGRNNQLQEHVGDRVSAWNAGAQLQTGISRVMPRGRILGGAGCRCPLCGLLPHLPPYLPSQSTGKPLF